MERQKLSIKKKEVFKLAEVRKLSKDWTELVRN